MIPGPDAPAADDAAAALIIGDPDAAPLIIGDPDAGIIGVNTIGEKGSPRCAR